jgi:hypothetical protein
MGLMVREHGCLQQEQMSVLPQQPDQLQGPADLLFNGYRGLLPQGKFEMGVNLTTHWR